MTIYTVRSGPQVSAYAKGINSWPVGMCLNFCWHSTDYPNSANLPDANSAWAAAKYRHTTGVPPVGALVYWGGGQHGHIAVSVGGGNVRSTDYPSKGKVSTVNLFYLTNLWGLTYRGWSEDYAGKPIKYVWNPPLMPALSSKTITVANVRPGKKNEDVRRFKTLLWNKVGPSVHQKYWDRWQKEDLSTLGPASQDLLFDLYAWLTKTKGWKPVTKTGGVWPGRQMVAFVGGTPR